MTHIVNKGEVLRNCVHSTITIYEGGEAWYCDHSTITVNGGKAKRCDHANIIVNKGGLADNCHHAHIVVNEGGKAWSCYYSILAVSGGEILFCRSTNTQYYYCHESTIDGGLAQDCDNSTIVKLTSKTLPEAKS